MKETETRKKKKRKFTVAEILLFVVVLLVFCFSLYKVVTITMEYKKGQDEYKTLESFVQIEQETEVDVPVLKDIEPEVDTEGNIIAPTEIEKIEMKYHDNFVNAGVDCASLESVNSDFEGWLYIPGLSISYPVVLGTDNDYYLTHTFQKEENKSGALFLDQVTTNAFENYNTIIHGHNMKDGSMFGKLKNFYRNTKTYADNPYFYIYTEEKDYKYLIFSYYVTTAISDSYIIPNTEETYQTYKENALRNAVYKDVEGIPDSAPIVTLSTCYGANYTDYRLVVHGILVATQ